MAYRPAAEEFGDAVLAYPSTLHFTWSDSIRVRAGDDVREALEKAAEYKGKWEEYEKEMAAWSPPAPKPSDDDEDEEDEDEKEEKDDDKKSKKKKDKAPQPVTGVWVGELGEETFLRLRLLDDAGQLEGSLRCEALSDTLVELTGSREEAQVTLSGLGTSGMLSLTLESDEGKLTGKATQGGAEHEVSLEQTSKEYVVARRTLKPREEEAKPPKGMPRSPGINPDLEPLRQAMLGKGTIFVDVSRYDEIRECVQTFAKYGIKPVLVGASGATAVQWDIRDHIAGVLPSLSGIGGGSDSRAKVSTSSLFELQAAGLPIAMRSMAEEGAVELPVKAAMAVADGLGAGAAVRALTSDAARMLGIGHKVGTLKRGMHADVLLLDGPPLALSTQVVRVWVAGKEVRP